MTCPGNGIYVVQGEMAILVTAMKRGARWSSHSHQDEDQDVLIRSFTDLKDVLNQIGDLRELDPNHYLGPFLEVIRSEETTGPVTSLALSAVNKFLSYRLIDPAGKSVPATVENIADAVTHARFVGTDQASDGVVLMKILQVLRTLVLSPEGVMLTNESVCEIMLSCFRICFESRLSELLRRSAEHCLKDMVQLLFSRLPQFAEDLRVPLNIKKLKMRTSAMDPSRGKRKSKTLNRGKPVRPVLKNDTPVGLQGKNISAVDSKVSQPNQDLAVTSEEITSPVEKLSIASSLHAAHLATTPITPAGNIVDMQGAISQCTPLANEEHRDRVAEVSPGEMDQSDMIADQDTPRTNESATSENIPLLESGESQAPAFPIVATDCSGAHEPVSELSPTTEEISSISLEENQPLISNNDKSLDENIEGDDKAIEDGKKNDAEKLTQGGGDEEDGTCLSMTSSQEYINPRGVRFMSQEVGQDGNQPLMPYGVVCVRELFRFLISLCNPMDKQNTETMIHMGLTLLTVSLEIGADSIGKYNSFLSLVKDEFCRNLFALLNLERLSIFAADLQVSFLLFESLRTHLKFQLEMFLTKLIDIIVSDSQKITYEQREIALDCVVQLWRIPGLVTELYLNYDCDLYCPNLFEDLTKLLSKNAFPVSGIYNTHLLSLDALLTIIDAIESHCHSRILNERTDDGSSVITSADSGTAVSITQSSYDITGGDGTADSNNYVTRAGRQKVSDNIPSHEQLMAIKRKKKLLASGTEHFNSKPKKGIEFLQDHHLLSTPLDATEVVHFLRENPRLDKKMIGEYISSRNNLQVLDTFVKSFDFTDTRIDEALRLYLETFRLPGESPLISLIMEHFAEHWHKCNGEPFANADAAFTLAYAVIMLNVDQHNYNVKRQNNPMTVDEFKKNVKKVNGGEDFDQEMLDEIYVAIKSEEIVMPAEQTGLVRENYLWKVLLRRGMSKDGVFVHAPNGLFDHDLFSLIWGPTVAALSYVFDKSNEVNIYHKAISGFRKCAMISAHYGMSNDFDNLVVSLCKFTTLVNSTETPDNLTICFGSNPKAQLAAKTLFQLVHRHGDILREGWKNILDCILQLYWCKLLPKALVEAEDFIDPCGKIYLIREETPLQKTETGLFSSLYSYIALASEPASQKVPSPEDQEYMQQAQHCIKDCHIEQLITESKFLRLDSLHELVKALILASQGPTGPVGALGATFDEDSAVFFLEVLLKVTVQNRDRVNSIWQCVRDHIYSLVMGASACDHHFLLERSVVGLLRLAIRLMRREDMSPVVLQSLRMLLLLKSATLFRISRQIAYGLYELLKTSAANIHSATDWSIIFTLLECVGGGAPPPRVIADAAKPQSDQTAKSDSEVQGHEDGDSGLGNERGYTSDSELSRLTSSRHQGSMASLGIGSLGSSRPTSPELSPNNGGGWILVGPEGEIQPLNRPLPINQFSIVHDRELLMHDPYGLVKCCESVAFLVRDVAHITPYNFENCVHCIRTFVEASLDGTEKKSPKRVAAPAKDKPRKKSTSNRRKDEATRSRSPQPSNPYDADESDSEEMPSGYQQISIQLLDLMHTLHTRTAQIFRWWAEENGDSADFTSLWSQGWCPLLQGIARLCCDSRRQVRMSAITYLQRALLVHDLQTLSAPEWESCFNQVLFPLLAKLLEPITDQDLPGLEETRMRAATVLSKVFLHHLTPLQSLPTFTALWLTILDFMDKYMHADNSDLLFEAIPESLKNMLLVMDSANVFTAADGHSQLWTITWDRIGTFLPTLREELFKSHPSVEGQARLNGQESLSPPSSLPPGEPLSPDSPTTSHPVVSAEPATITSSTSTTRASSIILQPPATAPTQPGNNAIFTHIGHMGTQMVSTPIGPSPHMNYTLSSQTYTLTCQSPISTPVHSSLPADSPITHPYATPSTQPMSLYSQHVENPYTSQPVPLFNQPDNQYVGTSYPVSITQPLPALSHPPLYSQPPPSAVQPVPLFASFASSFDIHSEPITGPLGNTGSNIPSHYFFSQERQTPQLFSPNLPQLYSQTEYPSTTTPANFFVTNPGLQGSIPNLSSQKEDKS